MTNNTGRKGFFEAWIDDTKEDIERYGQRTLVPTVGICALIAGLAISFLLPKDDFYRKPEISLFFITALVTINGFLLALSWSSFGKIYEIASRSKFSAFLRRHNLLNSYMFHVDFIHMSQIGALGFSFASLVTLSMKHIPLGLVQITLAAAISTSIYALKNALGAVKIMQDLVWYSALFDEAGEAIQNGSPDIVMIHSGSPDQV